MVDVKITNGNINEWYDKQNTRNEARDQQTLKLTIAFAAQLIVYYELWDDAIGKRDEVIDKQKDFLDYLLAKDLGVDYPMMQTKQTVLGLSVPTPDLCRDARYYDYCSLHDGRAVDQKALDQSKQACGGMPNNWTHGEGVLAATKASSYGGGILTSSAKRRKEHFRKEKTKLVLRAQATARMSPHPILKDYAQAISIQEGLAAIFAAGFNSAGVGLGSALEQMMSSNTTGAGGGG